MLTNTMYPKPDQLLPHREPMLLVDEITGFEPEVGLTAQTTVHASLPFFKGHFPGHPMLPGVILVEMMFQTCGLYGRLEANRQAELNGKSTPSVPKIGRAIKIDKTSFLKPVLPGETLTINVKFKQRFMDFSVYNAQVADSHGDVVAKGQVTVHLVSKPI